MTITIDIEDTVIFHRNVGEETRLLGFQDMPTIPRRPQAGAETADKTAFGVAATSFGEPPIVFHYAGRHRRPELPPVITPVAAAPTEAVPPFAPRRGLFAWLLGRIGG